MTPHGWHALRHIVCSVSRRIFGFPGSGPLLRFAAAKLPVVPLWKVIVGPRAGKLQPDPSRVRFLSFAIGANHIALLSKPATARVGRACAKTKARLSSGVA
jgi:hypothetical protein